MILRTILFVTLMTFAGCKTPPVHDDPWILGKEIKEPYGCTELKDRDPDANC